MTEQYKTKEYSCSPIFQCSNTSLLQSSASPGFHHSTTPTLQFSNTPSLQHSNTPSCHIRIAITFLIIFFFFTSFAHASPFKGPWDQDGSKKISRRQRDHKINPIRFLVEVYRSYISPIDGKNCPMYPTCSKYSVLSFKKHGFFIGWMMTCDRLFRCGRDELRLSPWITVNGEIRCYDPLENNDFWWYNGH